MTPFVIDVNRSVIVAILKPVSVKIFSQCPIGIIYHGYDIEDGQARRLSDCIGIWRHVGAL